MSSSRARVYINEARCNLCGTTCTAWDRERANRGQGRRGERLPRYIREVQRVSVAQAGPHLANRHIGAATYAGAEEHTYVRGAKVALFAGPHHRDLIAILDPHLPLPVDVNADAVARRTVGLIPRREGSR